MKIEPTSGQAAAVCRSMNGKPIDWQYSGWECVSMCNLFHIPWTLIYCQRSFLDLSDENWTLIRGMSNDSIDNWNGMNNNRYKEFKCHKFPAKISLLLNQLQSLQIKVTN